MNKSYRSYLISILSRAILLIRDIELRAPLAYLKYLICSLSVFVEKLSRHNLFKVNRFKKKES